MLRSIVPALFSSLLLFAACSGSESAPPPDGSSGTSGTSGASSGTSGASSGTSGTSGTSGASGTSGTSGASGSSGAPCTSLAQQGVSVDIIATKAAMPEATGGAPVDGTYTLTAVRAFTGIFPEGNKVRTFGLYTLTIVAGGKKFEQTVTNDKGEVTIASGDLESSDVNFKATPTCQQPPNADAGVDIVQGKYTMDPATATPVTLKMYVVRDFGVTAELTFTKK